MQIRTTFFITEARHGARSWVRIILRASCDRPTPNLMVGQIHRRLGRAGYLRVHLVVHTYVVHTYLIR